MARILLSVLLSSWVLYIELLRPAFGFSIKTSTSSSTSVSVPARPSSPPPIIACKSTAEVNKAIDAFVNINDVVLELGAQLTGTSTHLCRAVGSDGTAVLVDVKRKEATSGRSIGRDKSIFLANNAPEDNESRTQDSTHGESFVDRVEYHELDQFDRWRDMMHMHQYDTIILDVGATIGNDLYLSALSIAYELIANQQSSLRAIIVKSKVLNNLSRRIIHSQRLLDGTIKLPTKDELQEYPDPLFIPCVGVQDYRSTIPFVIEKGDHVIEVGCHYGTSTIMLHDAVMGAEDDGTSGFCAGVDIGDKIIQNAKNRYPNVVFEVVDAWDTLDLLKVKLQHMSNHDSSLGYDVVYADIGGLSGAHGLLESLALLDAIGRALDPRCIVIKSLCMKRLASQLIPLSKVRKRTHS